MHTCVMGRGWKIYSNVFRRMMKSLPFTKYLPFYASAAEAATNVKIFSLHVLAIQAPYLTF